MTKKIVKWLLLAFVAAAVVTQIAKSFRTVEETTFADGKHLVFFHAKVRCPTCIAMERLVQQVLDADFRDEMESGVFDCRILDYESPESRRIVNEYNIATATVLLFEQKEGMFVEGRNLAESCWKLVGDELAFRTMLKTQIESFLQGKRANLESESEEILLDPDLDLFDEAPSNKEEKEMQ